MFLWPDPGQMGYTRAREQTTTSGAFLMLFCRELGGEIRACVRTVKLRQCGPLVAGHVTLAGVRVFLSGVYGRHGLPLDCGEKPFPWFEPRAPLWERLTPVPEVIAAAYWRDYTGRFGPFLRQWATTTTASFGNSRRVVVTERGRSDG